MLSSLFHPKLSDRLLVVLDLLLAPKTLALGGKIPTGAGRSPWKAKSNTTTPKVNCLLGTLPKRLQGNGTEGRSHSIHSMHVFNSWARY